MEGWRNEKVVLGGLSDHTDGDMGKHGVRKTEGLGGEKSKFQERPKPRLKLRRSNKTEIM